MKTSDIYDIIVDFMSTSGLNEVGADNAIEPELAGMQIYDAPLVGVADADDALFTEVYRRPEVIGPHFRPPEEWLPGAKRVISFFLPFTRFVRDSNRPKVDVPYDPDIRNQRCSAPWLHARIEGQACMNALCSHLAAALQDQGYRAAAPSVSPDFKVVNAYSSNWSERHAAYAAGLGTFGLSRGLITKKGMAGRFGSVITDAPLPVTQRPYDDPFQYCTMCGACQARCPAGAIDKTRGCIEGKDQNICGPYMKGSYLKPHGVHGIVRYGCGKCQVNVPCEERIPCVERDVSF